MTKLDVLDEFETIKICIEYKNNKPIYKEYKGWKENISKVKKYDDLPENARKYIEDIQKYLDVPIDIISNGPGREQNIIVRKFF